MDRARLGQINRSAADVYEEFFVPALFLEPARLVARAGQIRPGQLVLDVACGTGVLARQIAQESGPDCVIGIDRNEGMLADAGARKATIETVDITAHFPSLEAWVQTDVKGWSLADMIDDGQYQTLLKAAREELGGFELSDGTVAFNSPAHIATLGGPS